MLSRLGPSFLITQVRLPVHHCRCLCTLSCRLVKYEHFAVLEWAREELTSSRGQEAGGEAASWIIVDEIGPLEMKRRLVSSLRVSTIV